MRVKLGKFIIILSGTAYLISLLLNSIGVNSWLPPCLITRITGVDCLACGMSSAAISLLRGDMVKAFELNPFIYLIISLAFLLALVYYLKSPQKTIWKEK